MPRYVDEGWWLIYALGPVKGGLAHLERRSGFFLLMGKPQIQQTQNEPQKANEHWIQEQLLRPVLSVLKKDCCLKLLYSSPRKLTADMAPQGRTWPGPLTNWSWVHRASWIDWESVMDNGQSGAPQTSSSLWCEAPITAPRVRLPSPSPWCTALPNLPRRQRSMQPALSASRKKQVGDAGQYPNLQPLHL